jgi:hypothetical protein
MQTIRSALAEWFAGALILLALIACAGPVPHFRPVDGSLGQYVRLESREGRFAHPVALKEAGWEKILREVRVQPHKRFLILEAVQSGPQEAFTESQRQYLARQLTRAFAEAVPHEWVVFCLSSQRGQEGHYRGGSGVTELTTGGFFVEDGQLHLVLANYRYAVSMEAVEEQIRQSPLRPAGDRLYELVPGQYQSVHQAKVPGLIEPIRARSQELVFDYQAFLSFAEGPVQSSVESTNLEERMRTLKRLYEQKLITEDEYQRTRKALLDRLRQ